MVIKFKGLSHGTDWKTATQVPHFLVPTDHGLGRWNLRLHSHYLPKVSGNWTVLGKSKHGSSTGTSRAQEGVLHKLRPSQSLCHHNWLLGSVVNTSCYTQLLAPSPSRISWEEAGNLPDGLRVGSFARQAEPSSGAPPQVSQAGSAFARARRIIPRLELRIPPNFRPTELGSVDVAESTARCAPRPEQTLGAEGAGSPRH